MIKAKKVVLCLLFFTTFLLNFEKESKFVLMPKMAENVQSESIDERLYRPYLNIQQEGVDFKREAFENNVLYPMKGQISNEKFALYEKQCDYVETTANEMTKLAGQGKGHIESDGTFVPKEDVRKEISDKDKAEKEAKEIIDEYPEIQEIKGPDNWLEEFFHQPMIKEFSWNLFSGFDIYFGPSGTSIMGLIGIVTNAITFSMSLSRHLDLSHSPKEILTQGICGNPTLFESDFNEIGNFILDNSKDIEEAVAQDIAGVIIGYAPEKLRIIIPIFMTALAVCSIIQIHAAFWIIQIVLTIIGLYLPSFLIGTVMLISGLSLIDYHAKINLFGSDYSSEK